MKLLTAAQNIIDKHNAEVVAEVKAGMSQKRLIMMSLRNEPVDIEPYGIHAPDNRVWTRGDGHRYKDPGYIEVCRWRLPEYHRSYSTFKRLYPSEHELLERIWNSILAMPGAKDAGTITPALGNDRHQVIKAGGVLWVKRDWGIEFGSPSRLKSAVWRHKLPGEA
jgi:hypothetical protein